MFEHGLLWSTLLLSFTLLKATLAAVAVVYPSYKTYKALESRSLQAAQGMLLYWTISAFVNSLKEIVDHVLGTYSNVFVWKFAVLALKAAPLIIGPERMYTFIIKPLFEAHEEQVDAVVDTVHTIKGIAQEAVPAAKAGDVDTVKAKAGAIAEEVKESGAELVESIKEQAEAIAAAAEEKAQAFGLAWNREGLIGVLEQCMLAVERVRDALFDQAEVHWQQHGPTVKQQAVSARTKGAQLYSQHAPVVQQKVLSVYQQQVLPRVQPIITKANDTYTQSIRPVVQAKLAQGQQVWEKHGGPVRTVYTERALPLYQNKVQPMWEEQVKPWLLNSFLPAVWETLIALKDRLLDLVNPPSPAVRTQRAEAKQRRRDATERKQTWKRRGDKVARKWQDSFAELDAETTPAKTTSTAAATAPEASESVAQSAIEQAATLRNRTSGAQVDSSLGMDKAEAEVLADHSDLDASAKPFEPMVERLWADSKPATTNITITPATDKVQDKSTGLGLKDAEPTAYTSEPRSGRLVEPILPIQ